MVLALAVLAASGAIRRGSYPQVSLADRERNALRFGHRLFIPAMLIPVITLTGVLLLKNITISGSPLLSKEQTTVICLGLACLVAFLAALKFTGERLPLAIQSSRSILDAIGWAVLLPLFWPCSARYSTRPASAIWSPIC